MSQRPERPSANFSWAECACNCCGKLPDWRVIVNTCRFLEEIRRLLGDKPLWVNSFYRCPEHNRRVGGASNSMHLKGYAVDFTHATLSPAQVQEKLRPYVGKKLNGAGPFGGLGVYISKGFVHVDRRTDGPATWRG